VTDASAVPMDDLLAHRQWVRALARRLAADENAADDLEQATWLAAVERPPRHAASPRGWLSAVMRNIRRNERRGDFRRGRREESVARDEASATAPDLVAEAEEQTILVREVLALDEPYRSTVLLRWFDDLTPQEIAERQGVPLETVRTRLKRAVERLRERMDARHGGDRKAWCLLLLGPGGAGAPTPGNLLGPKAAAASAAGGLAMAAATKIAVAAALLVAIGAGAWWARSDVAPPAAPAQKDAASASPAPSPKHERRASADETAPPAATTVDLSKADRDLDLFGTVVRADGSPVVGATVQAVDYPWLRSIGMFFAGHSEGRPGASTTSVADGAFVLRLRRAESTIVRVSADGLATRLTGAYQAGARVKIVMTAAVILHVTVRDESGAPVASAGLRLIDLGGRDDDPWIDASAVTDATGKCVFDGLPGGSQPALMPISGVGDFGQQRVKLPAAGETSVDVVSPKGRTLRGRVFDAVSLSPVAGASVVAWPFLLGATTDGGGRFEFHGWTGKNSRLQAIATGYSRVGVAVGADDSLEISMRHGFAATGRIIDADSRPVAGVYVAVESSWRDGAAQQTSIGYATSDADGRFRIVDLDRAKPHVLSAFAAARGRVRQLVAVPRADAESTDVGDVRLPAPRAIEGRALKPDGAPSPGATVRLKGPIGPWSPLAEGLADNEERRTDDLGRFRFGDLAPGDYTVELQAPNASPQSADVKLPADRDVLDVVLPPKPTAESIVVRVVDESGAPVAGMNVISDRNVNARTDAAGRAVLAPPAQGKITRIDVGAQTDEAAFLRNPSIKVEAGKREYVVTMEKGVHVACRLLDADGNPLPRASISVEPGERAYYFSMPDVDGRFRVTIPRQGEFSIVFNGCVYAGEKMTPTDSLMEARADGVTAQSGEVVLRCRRVETGRTATVRVLAADGSPVVGEEVRLFAYAGVERKAKTDAEGRARFDDLPAHEFHANVTFKPGALQASQGTFVPNGQEIALKYPASTTVTGMAALVSGGVEPNVSVMVYRGDFVIYMTRTDRDGRFSVQIPTDDAGPFRIAVSGMKSSGEREVTLQDREVRIELKPR